MKANQRAFSLLAVLACLVYSAGCATNRTGSNSDENADVESTRAPAAAETTAAPAPEVTESTNEAAPEASQPKKEAAPAPAPAVTVAAPPVAPVVIDDTPPAEYPKVFEELRAEIKAALPSFDEQKMAAFLESRKAEQAAEAMVAAAQKGLGKVKGAQGLVAHAKGKWIGGAEKGIAQSKAKINSAKTAAERAAAQQELAKWEKNKQDGLEALKQRQAALDQALREEPALKRALQAANDALDRARANTIAKLDELGIRPFLASDELDAKLAKFVVMLEAKPEELAKFAGQGEEQRKLIGRLLGDADLMKQMAVADGARSKKERRSTGPAQYGPAMKIYTDIRKANPKARDGVLQRLALAIGLEHAIPVAQRNPKAATDAPATIDPVKRYKQFEKAYLGGELDPAFKELSTWDLRMVVNGNEPDETHVWGREMLRNYRPDHITTDDYRWRYVAAVRTDIKYGSQDNKYDKPELQFFQNILMNGGVCGRRAFFGRFILRSFGIPTTARPQRGHAALAHWTPEGWVVCLGGGWGIGWTKTRYDRDLDFLANTQARGSRKAFLQVKRAQWIGDVLGEEQVFGLRKGSPGLWYGVSLYVQRQIIEEAKAVTLAAVGTELGEANESNVKYAIANAATTDADRKIAVAPDGTITIPAVACSNPTKSTGKIIFMKSVLGGFQIHYSRTGGHQNFEYTIEAPAAGKYALTAKLATPSWKQHLFVTVNDSKEKVDVALPHTVGMWETTKPVVIALARGKNVLTFSREHDRLKGVTIKEFVLRPMK